jgi:uncharacterized protein
MIVKPSAEGLLQQVKGQKGPPPVHLWNPPFCGDIDILVTPVEKVRIKVDDAPLLAVDFTATGTGRDQVLTFVTRTEDEVACDAMHPLTVTYRGEEPAPYIHVRAGLNALIDRKSFYRLCELGCHEPHNGESWFGLWSHGHFMPVIRSSLLP